jgi:hypothetical protein
MACSNKRSTETSGDGEEGGEMSADQERDKYNQREKWALMANLHAMSKSERDDYLAKHFAGFYDKTALLTRIRRGKAA